MCVCVCVCYLIKKIMYKSTNTGTKVQIVTFSSWCKRDEETRRKQTHLSAARGALAEARSWLQSDVNMQKARAGIDISCFTSAKVQILSQKALQRMILRPTSVSICNLVQVKQVN